MSLFFTQLRNSEYYARDDGSEHDSAEAALAAGVHSAMRMATDEVADGRCSAAIEITIEQNDGTRLLSSVVAISVSSMVITEKPIFDEGLSISSRF